MPVELAEIARPYAEAAHKHAAGAGSDVPGQWQEMLDSLAELIEDESVQAMLSNPSVSPAKARQGMEGLLGPIIKSHGDEGKKFVNFVIQLQEHDRLVAAGQIARRYGELRRLAEEELDIEIRSAFELEEDRVNKIAEKMKEKFGAKKVVTKVSLDPDLSGGVIVIAGDDVIDGSVKSELEKMRVSLRK